jgi:hypothetical protein
MQLKGQKQIIGERSKQEIYKMVNKKEVEKKKKVYGRKVSKKEIMDKIRKAGDSENYETSWDEKGLPISKEKIKVVRGKRSKSQGAEFERKVRRNLEDNGRFVDKWTNNVDLENNKIVSSKKIYNPFKKIMVPGAGFPDFISIQPSKEGLHSVIGVEVKTNGILSKIEKEKCIWYLKNRVFSQIWIAKAIRNGRKIEVKYEDFMERYGQKISKNKN